MKETNAPMTETRKHKKSAKFAVQFQLSRLKGENLRLQWEEKFFKKSGNWNNEIQAENYGKKLLVRGFINFLKDLQNNCELT
jgi:hypothetical protein